MLYLKLLILVVTSLVLDTKELGNQIKRFDNYKIYRVTPENADALSTLKIFQEKKVNGFDFWTSTKSIGDAVDIMVPPSATKLFSNLLEMGKFETEVFIENVQDLIDNENKGYVGTKSTKAIDWTNYYTLEEIHDWLRSLATDNTDTVTLIDAGSSHENRSVLGVKVSFSPKNANRGVFLEGTIHANEWIAGATVTWILNEILNSQDPLIRGMAENYDWYIFPVTNPDGFAFTKTENRLWRKTRTQYGTCFGADPNRNWDFQFGVDDNNTDPCSEHYKGPKAFSEAANLALSKYISSIAKKLRAYIAFHSYAQMLLIPYGYTNQKLDNYDDLLRIGLKGAESLAKRYNTQYTVGNIVDLMYVATGSSMDWVKGTYKTPITYAYELRDTGKYGFLLPASQIIPTSLETLDSLITILSEFDKIL